jgi:hypothetical protein
LTNGNNGIYYEKYHTLVQDPSAMVWQMTDESNLDNFTSGASGTSGSSGSQTGGNTGIHPGSYGKVSFIVTPRVDSINLDFTFEILGYTAIENTTSGTVEMTLLDSNKGPAKYLNGHILLFKTRTGTVGNYIYSDPILSNEDMKRVLSEQPYSGKGVGTPVHIYWVWPNTLSKIVDARSCERMSVTEVPFTNTSGTAYTQLVGNVVTYPDYYMKMSEAGNTASGSLPSGTSAVTAEKIAELYDLYGDYYDQADNDIGMGINFVLLKMAVAENTGSGT